MCGLNTRLNRNGHWLTITTGRDYVVLKIWLVTLTIFKCELLFSYLLLLSIFWVFWPLVYLEFPADAGSSNIWISQDDTLWTPVYKFPKQLRQWKILYRKSSLKNPRLKKKILKNHNHISKVNISKGNFFLNPAGPNTANSLPLTNEKNTRFYSTMNTQFVV